nr:MAG TPA: Glutaredoxin arsenate reductase [Caudoviricetes sp.]
MFFVHSITTLCRKTMCRMLFVCRKNSIFVKMEISYGFQTEI